jgi:hypothetical protein
MSEHSPFTPDQPAQPDFVPPYRPTDDDEYFGYDVRPDSTAAPEDTGGNFNVRQPLVNQPVAPEADFAEYDERPNPSRDAFENQQFALFQERLADHGDYIGEAILAMPEADRPKPDFTIVTPAVPRRGLLPAKKPKVVAQGHYISQNTKKVYVKGKPVNIDEVTYLDAKTGEMRIWSDVSQYSRDARAPRDQLAPRFNQETGRHERVVNVPRTPVEAKAIGAPVVGKMIQAPKGVKIDKRNPPHTAPTGMFSYKDRPDALRRSPDGGQVELHRFEQLQEFIERHGIDPDAIFAQREAQEAARRQAEEDDQR